MEENSRSQLLLIEILIVTLFFALSSTVILRLFLAANNTSATSTAITTATSEAQNWAERLYAQQDVPAFLTANGFEESGEGYTLSLANDMVLTILPTETKTDYGMLSSATLTVTRKNEALIQLSQKRYWPGEGE